MLDYLLSTFDDLSSSKPAEAERTAEQAGLVATVQALRAPARTTPGERPGGRLPGGRDR